MSSAASSSLIGSFLGGGSSSADDMSNKEIKENLVELIETVNQDLANHTKIASLIITPKSLNLPL